MKQCFKCRQIKPLKEFYRHPQMADGYVNKCKDCNKKDVRLNYQLKRDRYLIYEKERSQRSTRKKDALQYQKQHRLNNPEKYAASILTNNAIKYGKLKKQSCEKCGKIKAEAHHDNYYNPLDVQWLCRKHHLEVHGKIAYTW